VTDQNEDQTPVDLSEELTVPGKPSKMDLSSGSVATHLIRLSGNMLMGFVSVMTANLMETVYVGQLGTLELAAVSYTFPIAMILQGVGMGLSVGAASVVARSIGLGDMDRVHRLFTHCLLLVVFLCSCLAALVFLNTDLVFRLLGAQPEILPLATRYLQVWLFGLPFFSVAMVGALLMRAMGDAVRPGYMMILGSVLHIALGAILVFGWGPVPRLGIEGAAWSFVIARAVACIGYFYFFLKDRLMVATIANLLTSWRDILHVGLPASASNLIGPMSMGVITRLLAGHGPEVVAGFGVAARVESMILMILLSLSMSIGPLVGQNWGARRYERVKLAISMACKFSLVWGLISFITMALYGEFFVSLINDDPKVVRTASLYLLILPLSMGLLGIILNVTQCFNAFGKPIPPLIISVSQMLVLYVPLALLGDHLWGYVGIFAAAALTNSILGVASWFWINRIVDQRMLASDIASRK
jgi:putative MATE family efflux protein|tara:strand:- start:7096 stop:8511 length:1416 start_codon:yes stop_codon:yes gene_type:complete